MAGHTCETYRPRPRHVQWDETDRMEPLQEWGGGRGNVVGSGRASTQSRCRVQRSLQGP